MFKVSVTKLTIALASFTITNNVSVVSLSAGMTAAMSSSPEKNCTKVQIPFLSANLTSCNLLRVGCWCYFIFYGSIRKM